MKTKLLMTSSAVFFGIIGILLSLIVASVNDEIVPKDTNKKYSERGSNKVSIATCIKIK